MEVRIVLLAKMIIFSTSHDDAEYWQSDMDEDGKDKAAFVTFHEPRRYTQLALESKNPLATLQCGIEAFLAELKYLYALGYVGDVILFLSLPSTYIGHV